MAEDNATATVTATVIAPIAVEVMAHMVLGNLVAGNGTVTMAPNAGRTKTGSTPLSTSGAAPAGAVFRVTGEGASAYSISYTESSTDLTSGENTMPVAFITELGSATGKTATNSNPSQGVLSSGSQTISAGAAVTVGDTQAAGTYVGSLKVTVAYN